MAKQTHLVPRYMTDANMEMAERLEAYVALRGRSMLEFAIAWVASHDFVSSLIVGATSPDQVRENVAAIG